MNDKGFVLTRDIIGYSFNPDYSFEPDDYWDKKYLPIEDYKFRCEQYKKIFLLWYVYKDTKEGVLRFTTKYEDLNLKFENQHEIRNFGVWLFDFVMNGGLDNEKVEV